MIRLSEAFIMGKNENSTLIAKWLKRIFSLNGLTLFVSTIGVIIAYFQYSDNKQGEIALILDNDSEMHNYSDIKRFAELQAVSDRFCDNLHIPYIKNIGNKPIKCISVQVELSLSNLYNCNEDVLLYDDYKLLSTNKSGVDTIITAAGDSLYLDHGFSNYHVIAEFEKESFNAKAELKLPLKSLDIHKCTNPVHLYMDIKISSDTQKEPLNFEYYAQLYKADPLYHLEKEYNSFINESQLSEPIDLTEKDTEDIEMLRVLYDTQLPDPRIMLFGNSIVDIRKDFIYRYLDKEDNINEDQICLIIEDTLVQKFNHKVFIEDNADIINNLNKVGKIRELKIKEKSYRTRAYNL